MGIIQNFVSDTEKFTLDGVSSDTLGLYCDYLPPMPMAEQKYSEYNTGEDETLVIPDEVFSNISYSIRFYTFLADDYNDTAIKAFCANKTKLTLSRFPDYCFKIRRISLTAADSLGYGKRIDYVLTLNIAPFRYVTDEYNPQVILSAGDDIINEHSRYSKPEFEITGNGDITLTVNGSEFTVKGLETNQTIIIDSTRHVTYSGNTLLTGKTNGKYPLLNVGSNAVTWTGNVSSIKYKGNWRDL
jgi:phage-related protein